MVGGSEAAAEFSVNMTCGNCAQKIKDALLSRGIKSFEVTTFFILQGLIIRFTKDRNYMFPSNLF
jgi:hypothetical protein